MLKKKWAPEQSAATQKVYLNNISWRQLAQVPQGLAAPTRRIVFDAACAGTPCMSQLLELGVWQVVADDVCDPAAMVVRLKAAPMKCL